MNYLLHITAKVLLPVALLACWLVGGYVWAWNLFRFLTWWTAVGAVGLLWRDNAGQGHVPSMRFAAFAWAVLAFVLAPFGHFVYASLAVLIGLAYWYDADKAEQKMKDAGLA